MKVSVVKCKDYEQLRVNKAIEKSLRLIDFRIPRNKKILLKPNVLGHFGGARSRAITTDLAVIKAVAKIFRDNKLYLGDSSGQPDTEKALRETHIREISEKIGVKVVNFDKAEKVKVNFHGEFLRNQYIPKIVKKVDLIINLPKLKTHSFIVYTGAIKNLFGVIPGGRKSMLHNIVKTQEKFGEMLVDILKLVKPELNIMDAVTGMDGNGPSMGNPRHTGLIIASEDAVALDFVVCKIIGFNPEEIASNKAAMKENLVKEFEVVGEKDKKIRYEKPSTAVSGMFKFAPSFLREKIFERKLEVNKRKCKKCGICKKVCPVSAINYKPYPIWDYRRCILCHCCYETCPHKAIYIKENFFFKAAISLMKKLRG